MEERESVEAEFESTEVQIGYSSSHWWTRLLQTTDISLVRLRGASHGLFTTVIFGICWLIGIFLITCGLYMLSCEVTGQQKYFHEHSTPRVNEDGIVDYYEDRHVEYESVYSNWQIYINILGGALIQIYIGIMVYFMYTRNRNPRYNKSVLRDDLPPSYDDVVLQEEPPPTFSDLYLDFDHSHNFQDTSNLLSHQAPVSVENTVPVHTYQSHHRLQSGPLFSLHI